MHPDNAYLALGQIYRPCSLWTHACMHSLVFAAISHTSAQQSLATHHNAITELEGILLLTSSRPMRRFSRFRYEEWRVP